MLSAPRLEPGSMKDLQQSYFTQLITIIKAKLIKLAEWLSLVGWSL
ncbi:MAG: hypothetical protein PHY54_00750 [Methylococcales bacterium]|nr:hypothetical protein [Methylococcales bacterium]